ncbi:MAG: hypothetical protein M1819_005813 [Sarea resinae]|nr:MAG: hypothetical protein M1819_005813 [Sarea resinae]
MTYGMTPWQLAARIGPEASFDDLKPARADLHVMVQSVATVLYYATLNKLFTILTSQVQPLDHQIIDSTGQVELLSSCSTELTTVNHTDISALERVEVNIIDDYRKSVLDSVSTSMTTDSEAIIKLVSQNLLDLSIKIGNDLKAFHYALYNTRIAAMKVV